LPESPQRDQFDKQGLPSYIVGSVFGAPEIQARRLRGLRSNGAADRASIAILHKQTQAEGNPLPLQPNCPILGLALFRKNRNPLIPHDL